MISEEGASSAQSEHENPRAKLPRPGLAVSLAFGVLAVCLAASQLRILLSYSRWWVDEDGAMFWLVGREMLHFSHIDPNIWGQPYGTNFEAAPAELLHLVGFGYSLATPIADMLGVTASWAVLVAAAYWRGYRVSAALALALPTCLSIPSLLLIDQPTGFLAPIFLSAVAIAVAVAVERPFLRAGIMITLGWLSVLWDTAALIAVGPAILVVLYTDRRLLLSNLRATVKTGLAAAALPIAWMAWVHVFDATHSAEVVYKGYSTHLDASILSHNISHPQAIFGFYAPELIRSAWLAMLLVFAVILWAVVSAVRSRDASVAIAALSFLLILLIIASASGTAVVLPDIYIAGGRFLLPMPFAVWFIIHRTLISSPHHGRYRSSVMLAVLGAIGVITVASAVSSQVTFRSQINPLLSYDTHPGAPVTLIQTTDLTALCTAIDTQYRKYSAQIAVTTQNTPAYACAGEYDMNTIFPPFDRRLWVRDATQPIERLLLEENFPSCTTLNPKAGKCKKVAPGLFLLTTPPRTAAATLTLIGDSVQAPLMVTTV